MNLPAPWRLPLLALALAWLALAVVYHDTGAAMVLIWNRSETFAHAWVVPPLSAWLVWRRRADLAVLVPTPAPRWLWGLLPVGLLWLLGELAAVNAATQFALMGLFVLAVPALLGTEVARRIAFPLGFLFFAVPFGDFLTPWLIERTADFTVAAVRLSGIPVFREGTQFIIPSGAWSVVEACSGIRYLMASVMVGTLFAYLNYRSLARRWAFVGVAILTPLVANWLRAYMIVMLGHLSGNKLAVGVDHIIYGWVFFGIIMLAMFMVGARWAQADAPHEPAPALGQEAVAAPRLAVLAALSIALMAVPAVLHQQSARGVLPGRPVLAAPALPGWQWQDGPLSAWEPAFSGAAAVLHGRFEPVDGGAPVGVYIGYYRQQRPGHQLITSVNQLVAGGEGETSWALTVAGSAELKNGQPWRTAELRGQALSRVAAGGDLAPRLRVWQTYWINGRLMTSDWQAKLRGVWGRLLEQGDDAAVLIVYADKAAAGADDARLRAFLHQHGAALDAALAQTRDRIATPAR
nr:exosortase A [Pelomonas sp. P8]